jgi:hypothetical protein
MGIALKGLGAKGAAKRHHDALVLDACQRPARIALSQTAQRTGPVSGLLAS